MGIRLYEVKKYDNDIFVFDEIKPLETNKSIAMITKSSPIAKKDGNRRHQDIYRR